MTKRERIKRLEADLQYERERRQETDVRLAGLFRGLMGESNEGGADFSMGQGWGRMARASILRAAAQEQEPAEARGEVERCAELQDELNNLPHEERLAAAKARTRELMGDDPAPDAQPDELCRIREYHRAEKYRRAIERHRGALEDDLVEPSEDYPEREIDTELWRVLDEEGA